MYYLVYLSSATALLSETDLLQILQTSRKNNAASDITGMLLYYEGNIIQILEGEEQQVRQLFDIIQRDHRHKNIIEILEGPLEARNFPDWSMGIKKLSKEEFAQLEGINQPYNLAVISQEATSEEHPTLQLLKVFYTTNRHN